MTVWQETEPAVAGSARRIGALVLRHLYLLRTSWPRVLELMYWPTVQMILWGLVTMFLLTNSSWVAQASGVVAQSGPSVRQPLASLGADLRSHAD